MWYRNEFFIIIINIRDVIGYYFYFVVVVETIYYK